jgi:hypothetical protein
MAIVLKRVFPSRTSSESDAPTSGNAKQFVLTACSLRGFLDFADTKRQKERHKKWKLASCRWFFEAWWWHIAQPGRSRPKGRPKLRWEDQVAEDAATAGCRNWKTTAYNHEDWRKLLKEAKAHPGLLSHRRSKIMTHSGRNMSDDMIRRHCMIVLELYAE